MGVIPYTEEHVKLLARLMRAEAEGEGKQGMLMVGNVGVNRVLSDCLDFKKIRDLQQMVFQTPGGFEATQKGYFYQRARDSDIALARRVINAERFWPATYGLWFFRPGGIAPLHGLINRIPEDSNSIASTSHPEVIVRRFTLFS